MLGVLGLNRLAAPHGGFARAISIEAARLYPVHPALSDVDAAMLEPAAVAVHALRCTPLRLGDAVGDGHGHPHKRTALVGRLGDVKGIGAGLRFRPGRKAQRLGVELGPLHLSIADLGSRSKIQQSYQG